ncbi:MAG: hypothetical protein EOP86_25345 [Verrucomicrobiaceae bacterium]|nr:MAG: hypothetical protein EOP86_25345 [Verrucomicrobiaceae bacterium]
MVANSFSLVLLAAGSLFLGTVSGALAETSKTKSGGAKPTASAASKKSGPITLKSSSPSSAPVAASSKGAQGAVGPMAALPRVYAPTRPREVTPKFAWRKNISTTIFWIGEAAEGRNTVPNHKSSWDTQWETNYGGFDDPNRENRTYDYRPKDFIPRLNPFYVALPFNDLTNREIAKQKIPWYKLRKGEDNQSVCRGIWIAIRCGNKTCFAQWEDCGPFVTDDHDYVFGGATPRNAENNGAGLDVSPAVRDFLGISSGAQCDWRFCGADEVPDGPWTRFGTNNNFARSSAQDLTKLRAQYQELVRRREEWLKENPAR